MEEKKLSEFLKENNAYGSFVEYSVESFLKCLDWYNVFKSENNTIGLGNIFIWEDTKEGQNYWRNLKSNLPKPIEYDMNEIVFAEVERRDKMKNKVICDVCKGTKLYQVSNLEFEDCTKCKGKGYIIENVENNLDKHQLEYYLSTLKYIGESNLLNLLVPILHKYQKDFYEFYNLSILDRNLELETWIEDNVKDITDKKLLLKFKKDIYTGSRK